MKDFGVAPVYGDQSNRFLEALNFYTAAYTRYLSLKANKPDKTSDGLSQLNAGFRSRKKHGS